MDNKDMPAFPFYEPGSGFGSVSPGLSKREFIAAHMDARADIADYSLAYLESLVGRVRPTVPTTAEELLKWDAECEAKIKVIKADALLEELSKPQP